MAAPICAFFDYQFGRGIVLSVRFTAGEDLAGLDFDVALCLYRVIQEALTNERAGRDLGLRSVASETRRAVLKVFMMAVLLDWVYSSSSSGGCIPSRQW